MIIFKKLGEIHSIKPFFLNCLAETFGYQLCENSLC